MNVPLLTRNHPVGQHLPLSMSVRSGRYGYSPKGMVNEGSHCAQKKRAEFSHSALFFSSYPSTGSGGVLPSTHWPGGPASVARREANVLFVRHRQPVSQVTAPRRSAEGAAQEELPPSMAIFLGWTS